MKNISIVMITLLVSSLILITHSPVKAADKTVSDPLQDVASVDMDYNTIYITSHPDIDIDDLDITELTYTKNAGTATLTLQVNGKILNRGDILDLSGESYNFDVVGYTIQLTSSEETYQILYVNKVCQLSYTDFTTVNLTESDYSVLDDTFTATFSLKNSTETFDALEASTIFYKINLTETDIGNMDPKDLANIFINIMDTAPNAPLEIMEVYVPNLGSTGEIINFTQTLVPFSGQPPFTYNWDFGDRTPQSDKEYPTHIYTNAGTFTYNFTVSDQSDATTYMTGTITITAKEPATPASNQMILFLAVLLIIIVIGIVIIVWIIRR